MKKILLILLLCVSVLWHGKILRDNYHLNRAERLTSTLRYPEAFGEYEEAFGGYTLGSYARYRYGLTAQDYVKNSRYFGEEIDWSFVERAVRLQEENKTGVWSRFTRNYVVKGQLLSLLGSDGAMKELEQALELSPHRPSIYLDMAGVSENPEEFIKRAQEENPRNVHALWELTLLRIRQGRLEEAQSFYPQLTEGHLNLFRFENLRDLILALEGAGKQEVADHFRKMVGF